MSASCVRLSALIHINDVDDSVLDEGYFDTAIDLGEMWS
jgi:hypothetical protein